MADLTLNISQYSPLQQFTVRPWETFSPDDQLIITDKINLIVQTLNRLGKLSNDVVTDWNKVMTWVSNDGMTSEVDSQLQKWKDDGTISSIIGAQLQIWKDDGTLATIINSYTGIGDLTTLQTVAKDSLVHAINENVGQIAEILQRNNNTTTYTYNTDGTVQSVTEKDSLNNVIQTMTYTYNTTGDVATSISVKDGKTVTTTYTYDTNGNIISTANVLS